MFKPLVDYVSSEDEEQLVAGHRSSSHKGKELLQDCEDQSVPEKLRHEADHEKASCSYEVSSSEISLLPTLLAMGFSIEAARQAIAVCGTAEVDDIVNHILAHQHEMILLEEQESVRDEEDLTALTESSDVNLDETSSVSKSDLDNGMTDLTIANSSIPQTEATLLKMGFDPKLVKQAIKVHGESCSVDAVVDFVIGHSDNPELVNSSIKGIEVFPCEEELDNSSKLQKMGFSSDAVMLAIKICGDADYNILVDYIVANELAEREVLAASPTNLQSYNYFEASENKVRKKMKKTADNKDLENLWRDAYGLRGIETSDTDESADADDYADWERRSVTVSKKRHYEEKKSQGRCTTLLRSSKLVLTSGPSLEPRSRMTGFATPGFEVLPRELDCLNVGPPFFYFENVASMPKTEWDNITRFFDGVEPEFVDSKYFCACRRPRGYVHNLPLEGRRLILPQPAMTIHELLPRTIEYWPSWDHRTKLHCINTRSACDSICKKIRDQLLDMDHVDPPVHVQKVIMKLCSTWNLIWTGPGQPAPLEPHEIELILGFDEDHTRGASNKTERIQSLGNSFQINTVAYHLSVLKELYPTGIRVLSLFSGIGGAEVALHKLGIPLRYVVSVDINPKNRLVVDSWWKRTGQRGKLKHLGDVRQLTKDVLQRLIEEVGGFDLIIGGSPCNNLSGNNRVSRVGLVGMDSSLFYEFPRVLHIVRQLMNSRNC